MADVFNLTAGFDKASYNPGDTMVLSVTGSVTAGNPTPVSATLTVTAQDGTTTVLAAASSVTGAPETWAITAVSDTAGRTWTIAADGKSASATA